MSPMIITLPAGAASFLGHVIVSLLFGGLVWLGVFLWVDMEPDSPIPLLAGGLTSILTWLFSTGRIAVREAPR